MTTRRDFLTTMGAGLAATVPASRIPWHVLAAKKIDKVGLQLYTVRSIMKDDFDGTLAKIAEIGYREVEFAGYYNRTPQQVRATLDRLGLTAPSTHVDMEHASSQELFAAAKVIGHEYVTVAWIPEEQRKDLDGWKRVCDQFNTIGKACKAAGLQFAFHNHSYEFAPIGSQLPFDILLANTDPQLVQYEVDLFWMTFGGQDPLTYFAKNPGRFPMVHVKDSRPKPRPDIAPDSVMTDVGKGSIDWKRIFAQSTQAGIKHYFVEHDQPAAPLDSIRASFGYLHSLDF